MAWLMIMCRSRTLDLLRKQDAAISLAAPEELLEVEADGSGTPLSQLLSAEQDGLLRNALHTLTPPQRQLVALAFYKGLSHQEICDHTGMPLGTVKSHLKRAQDALKIALHQTALHRAQGAHHGD